MLLRNPKRRENSAASELRGLPFSSRSIRRVAGAAAVALTFCATAESQEVNFGSFQVSQPPPATYAGPTSNGMTGSANPAATGKGYDPYATSPQPAPVRLAQAPAGPSVPLPPSFPESVQAAPVPGGGNAYQPSPYQPAPYQASPYQASPYPAAAAPLSPYGPQAAPPPQAALDSPLPPLDVPWALDTSPSDLASPYQPRIRDVPIDVYVTEAQTGRVVLGGSVNTDLGVAGQIIVEERNFDITALPSRPRDLFNGAFRGGGQNFRLEALPGNRVQRYTVDLTEPNLFGYSPFSLSVGGFFFNRIYEDYDEERLGGRVSLGYVIRPDLSLNTEMRLENVEISNPSVQGLPELDRVLGDNDVYTGRVRLTHNTRDHPFLPTEGHLLELIYDQVFGEFDFPRGQVNYSRYFLVRQRPDFTGRHTLTTAYRLGFSGADTPLFENFFAGGFSTLRGFDFRGASPVDSGVIVGGRFQFLGSVEYMFPLTADDMVRMVTFVDYGTVSRDIDIDADDFRVAPGLGLRVAIPALGPAPLAFDFAVPVARAQSDDVEMFSFNAGFTR